MGIGIDFAAFGATNPFVGTTPYSAVDTFNSLLENNGAAQPLGSIYAAPLNPATISTNGVGLQPIYKYVRYNPTVSQTILAGPQLVYWKDETFTTVTGLSSESVGINFVAGWLLYNTTTIPQGSTSNANYAAVINGNYVWIQVGGFLPGAFVTAASVGDSIYGAASTFGATGHTAQSTAPPNHVAGWAYTAASSNLADLYVPFLN